MSHNSPAPKNGYTQFRRSLTIKLYKYRSLAPIITFLAVFLISLSIQTYSFQIPWDVALYESLRLFVINSDLSLIPRVGWAGLAFSTLRFLAPLSMMTSVIALGFDKFLNRPIILANNHIIVAGLGRLGFEICKKFTQKGLIVIALEKSASNPRVEALRAMGVRVLIGDATDKTILKRAKVKHARTFIAVTGSDTSNIKAGELAMKIQKSSEPESNLLANVIQGFILINNAIDSCLSNVFALKNSTQTQASTQRPLRYSAKILVNVKNPELRAQVSRIDKNEPERLQAFSSYQLVAKTAVEESKKLLPDQKNKDLVVIAGMGQLGSDILETLLSESPTTKLWLVDPALTPLDLANIITEERFQKMRDTICASPDKPGNLSVKPNSEYHAICEYLQNHIRLISKSITCRHFGSELLTESMSHDYTRFFICTDNDIKNVNFAERLQAHLSRHNHHIEYDIFVRQFNEEEAPYTEQNLSNKYITFKFSEYFLSAFFHNSSGPQEESTNREQHRPEVKDGASHPLNRKASPTISHAQDIS